MSDDFRRCPICREHGWFGNRIMGEHACKPIWECQPEWHKEPEDWTAVHATDAEAAAEKYAERYDQDGEYNIVSGNLRSDVIIRTRKPGGDVFERWAIEAETVPTYRATKLEDDQSPQENASD